MIRLTIVSGGQTGVDRGALAAALDRGVPCGGWCPAGRQAEDGTVPAIYPVSSLPGADYEVRTRKNVEDSDGTAIIFDGELEGGTRFTARLCDATSKPHVLIDTHALSPTEAAETLAAFLTENDIRILNVAGPRASKWPGAHEYTRALLTGVLGKLGTAAS